MSSHKITKKNLADKISERTGITKNDAFKFTEHFLDILKDSILDGKKIELRGFGVFKRVKSKKKYVRDLKKNTLKTINRKYRLKFKPSDVIINRINE